MATGRFEEARDEAEELRNDPSRKAELYDVIIDVHLEYPKGRDGAREWIVQTITALFQLYGQDRQGINKEKSDYTQQYLFVKLSGEVIRELVIQDAVMKTGLMQDKPPRSGPPAICQIWYDFKIIPLIYSSISTMKCDAAQTAPQGQTSDGAHRTRTAHGAGD